MKPFKTMSIDTGKNETYKVTRVFPCGTLINRWNLSKEFAEDVLNCNTYEEYQELSKRGI